MSKTVVESGRLFPFNATEEWAVEECERLGIEVDHDYTALKTLSTEVDQYTFIEGLGFCRVEDFTSTDPCEGWQNIKPNSDGSYSFNVCYYKGGAHWTEVVEAAIKEGSDDGYCFACGY